MSISSWNARNSLRKELLAVSETLGKVNAIINRYVAVQLADEVRNGNYAAIEDYLSEMSLIAQRYGATIDKFVGDAHMIFLAQRTMCKSAIRSGLWSMTKLPV